MANNQSAPSDFKWQSSYRKLIKIRSMNPKECFNETINGRPNPLYTWCIAQRRNKLKLTPKHLFQLEQINFPWESETKINSDKWDECFEQLVDLKMIHKEQWLDDILDDDVNPLGEWISIQRKNKRKLSKNKIEKLNEIGFNWNNLAEDNAAKWDKSFDLYQKYVALHATEELPLPKLKKNSVMESWCNYQKEHKDELSEEQLEMLNTVGFEWRSSEEIKNEAWENNYVEMLEYINNHNNKLPSDNIPDKRLRHLKYWYKYQLNAKELLNEEQLEKFSILENRRKKPEANNELKLEL